MAALMLLARHLTLAMLPSDIADVVDAVVNCKTCMLRCKYSSRSRPHTDRCIRITNCTCVYSSVQVAELFCLSCKIEIMQASAAMMLLLPASIVFEEVMEEIREVDGLRACWSLGDGFSMQLTPKDVCTLTGDAYIYKSFKNQ